MSPTCWRARSPTWLTSRSSTTSTEAWIEVAVGAKPALSEGDPDELVLPEPIGQLFPAVPRLGANRTNQRDDAGLILYP